MPQTSLDEMQRFAQATGDSSPLCCQLVLHSNVVALPCVKTVTVAKEVLPADRYFHHCRPAAPAPGQVKWACIFLLMTRSRHLRILYSG